jgi:hypothetical protein
MLRQKQGVRLAAITLLFATTALSLIGCHQNTPGVDPKLEQTAADANAIATKSGGDWTKLTQADKTVILNITHGNEASAKELLHGLSGKTYEGRWGTPQHPLGHAPQSGAANQGGSAKM